MIKQIAMDEKEWEKVYQKMRESDDPVLKRLGFAQQKMDSAAEYADRVAGWVNDQIRSNNASNYSRSISRFGANIPVGGYCNHEPRCDEAKSLRDIKNQYDDAKEKYFKAKNEFDHAAKEAERKYNKR